MTRPAFLFAHGAGLPSDSPWMSRWATALEALGSVVRFDYPYMAAGKKRPDRLPVLLERHRQALGALRQQTDGPVFLVGKSMGGRVGCHLAAEEAVSGVICLGYPLCAGGDRTRLRTEVLHRLSVPVLFVQGTRDRLAPLDLLEPVVRELAAPTRLYVVPTGDHSLMVTRTHTRQTGHSQEYEEEQAHQAISAFVAEFAQSGP